MTRIYLRLVLASWPVCPECESPVKDWQIAAKEKSGRISHLFCFLTRKEQKGGTPSAEVLNK